jgi:hypothetical protein
MRMDIQRLTSGLSYVGEATGKRRAYDVFRGARHYVVMSVSPSRRNAGNFTVVDAGAVARAARRFAGRKGVTTRDVSRALTKGRAVVQPLDALNILYVLVAEGRARVDTRRKGPKLHFNVVG